MGLHDVDVRSTTGNTGFCSSVEAVKKVSPGLASHSNETGRSDQTKQHGQSYQFFQSEGELLSDSRASAQSMMETMRESVLM